MKKKYIEPKMEPIAVDMLLILGASKVETGGSPQDEYDEGDVTYSRRNNNVWTDDEEEY